MLRVSTSVKKIYSVRSSFHSPKTTNRVTSSPNKYISRLQLLCPAPSPSRWFSAPTPSSSPLSLSLPLSIHATMATVHGAHGRGDVAAAALLPSPPPCPPRAARRRWAPSVAAVGFRLSVTGRPGMLSLYLSPGAALPRGCRPRRAPAPPPPPNPSHLYWPRCSLLSVPRLICTRA